LKRQFVKLDPNVTGLLSLVVERKIQNQKWLIINFLLEGKYLVIYDNQPKKF
jgi:hypothetical protein